MYVSSFYELFIAKMVVVEQGLFIAVLVFQRLLHICKNLECDMILVHS